MDYGLPRQAHESSATKHSRFEGLDALRGIAALLVVALHAQHLAHATGPFARCYLSVDLFFMLSGLVMARSYEKQMANGLTDIAFMAIRLRRLWPTMLIGTVIGTISVWSYYGTANSMLLFALALLFIPVFDKLQPTFLQNPPSWSIQMELFANALHAVILRHLGVRYLLLISAICGTALACFVGFLPVGADGSTFVWGPARVLFSYCAGIAIWRLTLGHSAFPGWLPLLILPASLLLISLLQLGWWADYLFVIVICPLSILGGLNELPFCRNILTFFGKLSFPLYAVHYPVLYIALHRQVPVFIAYSLAVLIAWATANLIEDAAKLRGILPWRNASSPAGYGRG